MAHKHDWFDDYMMYSMLNAGRNGGGDNSGCSSLLVLIGLGLIVFGILTFIAEITA